MLESRLLFGGALGGWHHFEPLIGNRLTALNREAIGAVDEPPLGPQISNLPPVEWTLRDQEA